MDFGGLVLTVAGKTEDYEIKLEDAEKSVEGTVTTYTITSAAWLEMLRSEPQQITLGGTCSRLALKRSSLSIPMPLWKSLSMW